MLKKFVLSNFKNFRDEIKIDFEDIAGYQFSTDCISDNIITKMLIYGKNATGKTNLGKALIDIVYLMIVESVYVENSMMLNADSSEDYAKFSYTFGFGDDEIVYQYTRFSNRELRVPKITMSNTATTSKMLQVVKFIPPGRKQPSAPISLQSSHLPKTVFTLSGIEIKEKISQSLPPPPTTTNLFRGAIFLKVYPLLWMKFSANIFQDQM